MALLDMNTILSLNKDNKSVDTHNVQLAKMKNVNIAPEAKHDFIADRARKKDIKNIDSLYDKLNDLEKNGVLDIWMKKFGKDQYMRKPINENFEISSGSIEKVQKILTEMDGAAAAGMTSVGAGPAATMGGMPGKNKANPGHIINKHPETSLMHTSDKTHQDTNLGAH